jgi:hypothetical protein
MLFNIIKLFQAKGVFNPFAMNGSTMGKFYNEFDINIFIKII